jgi:putative ABC transport system permease protein
MFKSFLRYKYKTALILLSATSAIASIFLITALGNGIIGMYADMLKTDGDIIVMQRGVADTFFSDVNLTLADSIGQIEGVASAQGVIVGAGAIDIVPIAGIYGVTRNRMPNYILSKGTRVRSDSKTAVSSSILPMPKSSSTKAPPFCSCRSRAYRRIPTPWSVKYRRSVIRST